MTGVCELRTKVDDEQERVHELRTCVLYVQVRRTCVNIRKARTWKKISNLLENSELGKNRTLKKLQT